MFVAILNAFWTFLLLGFIILVLLMIYAYKKMVRCCYENKIRRNTINDLKKQIKSSKQCIKSIKSLEEIANIVIDPLKKYYRVSKICVFEF